MCNQSEWIVREAFLAYARGDVARMMEFVDPDVEWIYLRPDPDDPDRACRGRRELEQALLLQASRGLQPEVEEVVASGEKVMLVMRTPSPDQHSERLTNGRTYDVVTVKDGLIVCLRACHDRLAARSLIGIG